MRQGVSVELVKVGQRCGEAGAPEESRRSILVGSHFGLSGPSGCGKTATARIVTGLDASGSDQPLVGPRGGTVLAAQIRADNPNLSPCYPGAEVIVIWDPERTISCSDTPSCQPIRHTRS